MFFLYYDIHRFTLTPIQKLLQYHLCCHTYRTIFSYMCSMVGYTKVLDLCMTFDSVASRNLQRSTDIKVHFLRQLGTSFSLSSLQSCLQKTQTSPLWLSFANQSCALAYSLRVTPLWRYSWLYIVSIVYCVCLIYWFWHTAALHVLYTHLYSYSLPAQWGQAPCESFSSSNLANICLQDKNI